MSRSVRAWLKFLGLFALYIGAAVLIGVLLAGCAVEGRVREMAETVVPLRRGDADVLARTLYGEARGEGLAGMEAIAWVVVNRVRRPGPRFPDTVAEVCRQKFQFSCFNPGDPNAKLCAAINESDPHFALALYAATGVLTGRVPDPTGGADHYFLTRMKDPPEWRRAMILTARIGAHSFYRE